MFPIALNLTKIPVLLVGHGELLERRIRFLDEAGATKVTVNSTPTAEDISRATIVMVAGLPRVEAAAIAAQARALGKLVNVEDINELCDFYFTANVRRGDLVIAVSTSGASPTLARKIRDKIADMFGPEWEAYVNDMAERRQEWKKQGAGFHQLIEKAEQYLAEKGWLNDKDKVA